MMLSHDTDLNLPMFATGCEHTCVGLLIRLKPQTGPGRRPHDLRLLETSLVAAVVEMPAASAHVLYR